MKTTLSETGFIAWLFGTVFAPPLVMTLELLLTRWLSLDGSGWDYAGLATSTATGLYCLWQLPGNVTTFSRVWLTVLYVPAAAGLLMLYLLHFVCAVFGDCL